MGPTLCPNCDGITNAAGCQACGWKHGDPTTRHEIANPRKQGAIYARARPADMVPPPVPVQEPNAVRFQRERADSLRNLVDQLRETVDCMEARADKYKAERDAAVCEAADLKKQIAKATGQTDPAPVSSAQTDFPGAVGDAPANATAGGEAPEASPLWKSIEGGAPGKVN